MQETTRTCIKTDLYFSFPFLTTGEQIFEKELILGDPLNWFDEVWRHWSIQSLLLLYGLHMGRKGLTITFTISLQFVLLRCSINVWFNDNIYDQVFSLQHKEINQLWRPNRVYKLLNFPWKVRCCTIFVLFKGYMTGISSLLQIKLLKV